MSTISAGTTTTTGLVQSSDTTGALVLQTGSSSTTALTLSSAQNATFANTVNLPNTFGFKNRIINGNMTIDQRNAGASVTPTSGQFLVDRWAYYGAQTSKFTAQQNQGSVTPSTGFTNYQGVTSSSAYTSLTGDFFMLQYGIEGYNVADLAWGTANAKTITLSFWAYSSLTGQFGGCIFNSAANRSYPFSYTVSSANTWTQISITIAGDTTGTWLTTNGAGMYITFDLGCGATYLGTAGSWSGGNYRGATGDVKIVGTSGATFYITGVQLEVGSQATSFDFRSYGTELALCQRYYETNYNTGVKPGTAATAGTFYSLGASDVSGSAGPIMQFKVNKRTTPTITAYTQSGASGWQYSTSSTSGTAAINVTFIGEAGGLLFVNCAAYSVAASVYGYWTASAEL